MLGELANMFAGKRQNSRHSAGNELFWARRAFNGILGAVKETYEMSRCGRAGLLNCERVSCCTS